MRSLLTALAVLAFAASARAQDPIESLIFTNGQAYTLADFAGGTVAVVDMYEGTLLGTC